MKVELVINFALFKQISCQLSLSQSSSGSACDSSSSFVIQFSCFQHTVRVFFFFLFLFVTGENFLHCLQPLPQKHRQQLCVLSRLKKRLRKPWPFPGCCRAAFACVIYCKPCWGRSHQHRKKQWRSLCFDCSGKSCVGRPLSSAEISISLSLTNMKGEENEWNPWQNPKTSRFYRIIRGLSEDFLREWIEITAQTNTTEKLINE